MKSAIKIIKRKQDADSNNLATSSEQSVERSTRDMVNTVKSWITDLQQRKRTEAHSFAGLPVVVTRSNAEYLETLA